MNADVDDRDFDPNDYQVAAVTGTIPSKIRDSFKQFITEDLNKLSVKELGLVYKLIRALITNNSDIISMRGREIIKYSKNR